METKKEVKFADFDSIELSKSHSNAAFEHENEEASKSEIN
jgi:hypothetical protein